MPTAPTPTRWRRGLVGLALLATMVPAPVAAINGGYEGIERITPARGRLSNVATAVRLSRATPGLADHVVIGRDDVFADSLASGLLQANGPLLLVPPKGPVPDLVKAEILRLRATTATVLGGEAAVAESVVDELMTMGLTVARRAGASRLETAVDVAATDAPNATSAILVRAFPSSGASDSQAFADSLGAGALAASASIPILLTQTEVLSGATARYLESSAIAEVVIVGGPAAVSEATEQGVIDLGITTRRIAGPNRFATGVAVANETRGGEPAERIVLASAEGDDAWAAGFAAARHAAATGAAMVFARDPGDVEGPPPGQLNAEPLDLPEDTASFLASPAFAGNVVPLPMTCVALAGACETAQRTIGYPATPTITVDPPDFTGGADGHGLLEEGQQVRVRVDDPEDSFSLRVTGACFDQNQALRRESVLTFGSGVGCAVSVRAENSRAFSPLLFQMQFLSDRTPLVDDIDELVRPQLISADPTTGVATGIDVQEPFRVSDDGNTFAWSMTGQCRADVPPAANGSAQVCVQRDGQRIALGYPDDGEPTSPTRVRAMSGDGGTVIVSGAPGLGGDDQNTGGTSCCLYAIDVDEGVTEVVSLDPTGEHTRGVAAGEGAVAASQDGRSVAFVGTGQADPEGPIATLLMIRERDEDRTVVLRDRDGEPLVFGSSVAVVRLDTERRKLVIQDSTNDQLALRLVDLDSGETTRLDIVPGESLGVGNKIGSVSDDFSLIIAQGRLAAPTQGLDPNQTYVFGSSLEPDGTVSQIPGVTRNVEGGPVGNARNAVVSPNGAFIAFNAPSTTTADQIVDAPYPRGGCGTWTTELASGETVRADTADADGAYTLACQGYNWAGNDGKTCYVTAAKLDAGLDVNLLPDLYCAPDLNQATLANAIEAVVQL